MTAPTTATTDAGTHGARTRSAIPAPRRSPENSPQQSQGPQPDPAPEYPLYPLVRYALDHATALRPRQD